MVHNNITYCVSKKQKKNSLHFDTFIFLLSAEFNFV